MTILKTNVLKTKKEEYIEENGEMSTYTLLYIPNNETTRALLYAEQISILEHNQREGAQIVEDLGE